MDNFKYRVLRMEPNITAVQKCAASVCMCSSHSLWTSSSLDVPAGVTQEEPLRGAPLLVGEQEKWYQQILQEVQNFVPHDYIKSCTVYTLVQRYVCVCFLPIHSGHQVRWTYQPGSHRRKVTQDFSSAFFLRCVPSFFSREGFSHSFPSSTVKSNFVY